MRLLQTVYSFKTEYFKAEIINFKETALKKKFSATYKLLAMKWNIDSQHLKCYILIFYWLKHPQGIFSSIFLRLSSKYKSNDLKKNIVLYF